MVLFNAESRLSECISEYLRWWSIIFIPVLSLDTSYSVFMCLFVLSSALSLSILKEQKRERERTCSTFYILKHYSYISQQPTTTVNQFTVGSCLKCACVFKLYGLKISLSCRQNTQNQNITVYQIQFSLMLVNKPYEIRNLNFLC